MTEERLLHIPWRPTVPATKTCLHGQEKQGHLPSCLVNTDLANIGTPLYRKGFGGQIPCLHFLVLTITRGSDIMINFMCQHVASGILLPGNLSFLPCLTVCDLSVYIFMLQYFMPFALVQHLNTLTQN